MTSEILLGIMICKLGLWVGHRLGHKAAHKLTKIQVWPIDCWLQVNQNF